MPKKQKISRGGRPGQNGNRPTNRRYLASKRWIKNSAKRIAKHLRVHGPLNPRREEYVRPTWEEVEEVLNRIGILAETQIDVRRLVKRHTEAS